MKRFTWQEMERYWKAHDSRYARLDYERDPEGLGNILHAESPLWLNRYYARFQKMVYRNLFCLVPPCAQGARALDVGCGAGRWCRFLADCGYGTVGIDLQSELIERNRRAYPHIKFLCASIQQYVGDDLFDLVSSVTVVQHVPFEEQDAMIHKMRALLKDNGHAIILENIHDQGPHVFSNSIKEWRAKFEKAGFDLLAWQRYDHSFFLRFLKLTASGLQRAIPTLRRHRSEAEVVPELFMASLDQKGGMKYFLRQMYRPVQGLAVGLDSLLEPLLIRCQFKFPTVHCGFLFKAL